MADLDDVLNMLATLAAGVIYPNGAGNASAVGCDVKIYSGWPVPNVLNDDIAAGNAHVSVYARPEERNTTRYPVVWQDAAINGDTGTALKEVGRQERLFQIVGWFPTPAVRSLVMGSLDAALRQVERYTLPDGSVARLVYKSSPMTDMLEKAAIYRRDLFYTVEYATTVTQEFYKIKQNTVNLTAPH